MFQKIVRFARAYGILTYGESSEGESLQNELKFI